VQAAEFDYPLPPDLIAQHPAPVRDHSKLMVLHREDRTIEHRIFADLPKILRTGDLLALNDSKVLRARLRARRATGAAIELLLIEEVSVNEWWCLLRPAKRVALGATVGLLDAEGQPVGIAVRPLALREDGARRVRFEGVADIRTELDRLGEVPLPPYIERGAAPSGDDAARYQTVYARTAGSVAAPTAGLHVTQDLLARLAARGVELAHVTLHVGLGTFAPVKEEDLSRHRMHAEAYEVSVQAAAAIARARREGRRVVALGTTSARTLETAALTDSREVQAGSGRSTLFIYPPCDFRVVDALVTNFHLPRSTLLMLVCAFASPGGLDGRDFVLRAYREAVDRGYRFYSYGDAMLIQ
jgi:S-adenosylmethionine:tRNA ribosyltransferase-isomerase